MRDFKKLEIWKDAHKLALEIYGLTINFPSDEKFGLVSQLRRSAVSVPTNIVEGCGRASQAELKRFCDISMGSASEVEYLLLFSKDLKIISEKQYM